jgi:hypothetical protein
MTPMATIAAARLVHRDTPGELMLLDRPLFKYGALAPRGREQAGAAVAVATAVPLAYLTLAGRKRAMARIGQTRSGLIEDALIVAAGAAVVALSTKPNKA